MCASLPLQDSLGSKVNVDDLASLMPQGTGSDDAASFMSKLLEIQNRLAQLEGVLRSVHKLAENVNIDGYW